MNSALEWARENLPRSLPTIVSQLRSNTWKLKIPFVFLLWHSSSFVRTAWSVPVFCVVCCHRRPTSPPWKHCTVVPTLFKHCRRHYFFYIYIYLLPLYSFIFLILLLVSILCHILLLLFAPSLTSTIMCPYHNIFVIYLYLPNSSSPSIHIMAANKNYQL